MAAAAVSQPASSAPAMGANNPFRMSSSPAGDAAATTPTGPKHTRGKPSGLKIDTVVVAVSAAPAPPPAGPLPPPPPPARIAPPPRSNEARPRDAAGPPGAQPQPPQTRPAFARLPPDGGSQRGSWAPSVRSGGAASPPPAGSARFSDPWAASRAPTSAPLTSALRNVEPAPAPDLSTPEELLDLWAAAEDPGHTAAGNVFHLGLQCPSLQPHHEEMTLADAEGRPFYAVRGAGPASAAVFVSRAHPLDPALQVVVAAPALAQPSATAPQIALLEPLNTPGDRPDPSASASGATMTGHATGPALLWDSDSDGYYLGLPNAAGTAAPAAPAAPLRFAIEPGVAVRLGAPAGTEPLLALDLTAMTLAVHAAAVARHGGAPLDALAAALLALLVHLNRHTALLAPPTAPAPAVTRTTLLSAPARSIASPAPSPALTDLHFDPPPTPGQRGSRGSAARRQQQRNSGAPRWFSLRRLQPLRAHPPSAPATPRPGSAHALQPYPTPARATSNPTTAAGRDHADDPDKDLEAALPAGMSVPIGASGNGVAPELRGSTTGVDLSRFQAFDLDDPELSKGTKAVLRVVYWLFGCLVWVLGTAVGVVAAVVVSVGSCAGGKGLGKAG